MVNRLASLTVTRLKN